MVIPPGTYIVGEQIHEAGKYPYYQRQPIFTVTNLVGLIIEGKHATLRLAAGLRYGSFDKDTGQPYTPKPGGFYDGNYVADVGNMLQIHNSRHVVIRDLELDGNSGSLILGGYWGDVGRQLWAYGLHLHHNTDVVVENVSTHHHGCDGILIGYYSSTVTVHAVVNLGKSNEEA